MIALTSNKSWVRVGVLGGFLLWSLLVPSKSYAATVDLAVDTLSTDDVTVSARQQVRINWHFTKTKTGSANGFLHGIYWSNDSTITASDMLLKENGPTSLGSTAGGVGGSNNIIIPSNAVAGSTYYIGYLVDSSGVVPETDENNNARSVTMVINAPVEPPDDHPDAFPEGTIISAPSITNGDLEVRGDRDLFVFSGLTGVTYRSLVVPVTISATYVRVYDSGGYIVAESGSGDASWNATTTQIFYIDVWGSGIGTYQLRLSQNQPPEINQEQTPWYQDWRWFIPLIVMSIGVFTSILMLIRTRVTDRVKDTAKTTTVMSRPGNDMLDISAVASGIKETRPKLEWDVFVCHASEDKDVFVRQLAKELGLRGLKIWYDEFTLKVGDSLRQSIEKGLTKSKYGIVVLSPFFFAKKWPQDELNGLVAKERNGEKVILPVWLNVNEKYIVEYSPMLADRVGAKASEGMPKVISDLLDVINP